MTTESKHVYRNPSTYGGYLTTGMAAAICKVAPRTVSKWFDRGWIKGHRIPGSTDRRISRDELLRFLKEHNMPVPPELQNDMKMVGFGVNDFDRGLIKHPSVNNFSNLFDLGYFLGGNPNIAIALLGTAHGSGVTKTVFDRIKLICPYAHIVIVLEPGDKLPNVSTDSWIALPINWDEILTQLILDCDTPKPAIRSYSTIMRETHDIREQAKTT